jgi:anti-sigma-K factor RskA
MMLRDAELREQLAARYVLGQLRGRARQRFLRHLQDDAQLQRQVHEWEARLYPLDEALKPKKPPRRVWRAVQRRLRTSDRPRLRTKGLLAGWRSFTAGAMAAALMLGVGLYFSLPPAFQPDYVAVIAETDGAPLWLVQAEIDDDHLIVTPLQRPRPPADKAYELWLLPAGDAAPVSLGLLPSESPAGRRLPAVKQIADAKGIAVSIEPVGGSPTGQPTGPVVYQAALAPAT